MTVCSEPDFSLYISLANDVHKQSCGAKTVKKKAFYVDTSNSYFFGHDPERAQFGVRGLYKNRGSESERPLPSMDIPILVSKIQKFLLYY